MEVQQKIEPVDATPTKSFFISMLTKDILLPRALIDLVDNSVDGARRIRGPAGDFTGLWVRVRVDNAAFVIQDNCGGMSVDVARKQAFRFGRPSGRTTDPHSIGQFGVGMKRAIFKLGNHFRVESATPEERFAVELHVPDWQKVDHNWEIPFESVTVRQPQEDWPESGTMIRVTELHTSVVEDLTSEQFRNQLRLSLQVAHQDALSRGLAISVQGHPVSVNPAKLLQSDRLAPASFERRLDAGDAPILLKVLVGLSAEVSEEKAGWYIYCNGRLILGPDQTGTTGWSGGTSGELPKFHSQYSRFRGYVFFDSDDPKQLPWNTTKTGVDSDSGVFRAARLHMIQLGKQVIAFLNKLEEERKNSDTQDSRPLEEAVKSALPVTVTQVAGERSFVFPSGDPPKKRAPKGQKSILFTADKKKFEAAQEHMQAKTNQEVCTRLVDYYLDCEGIEP